MRQRRWLAAMFVSTLYGCSLIAGGFGDAHLADRDATSAEDANPGEEATDVVAQGSDSGDGGQDATSSPTCDGSACVVVEISGGGNHTCALTRGGSVYCWGSNASGEVSPSASNPASPSLVPFATGATHVATGGIASLAKEFSCAIINDGGAGGVVCWGGNDYGQLGSGDTTTSAPYFWSTGAGTPAEISLGLVHGCARFGPSVQCWGNNAYGQLGRSLDAGGGPSAAQPLRNDPPFTALGSFDYEHACGIASDGGLLCWGSNAGGGVNPTADAASIEGAVPVGVAGATQVSSGNGFTCAVLQGGGTTCWGLNNALQLGRDPATGAGLPPGAVTFSGTQTVTQIAAGADHACALVNDGMVWCWGPNGSGQTGQTPINTTPVHAAPVANLPSKAVRITAGHAHTCALLETGAVYCWGANDARQLGVTDAGTKSATPFLVPVPP